MKFATTSPTTPIKLALDCDDITRLTQQLACHYPDWQVFYLYNHGKPIIGILPKIAFVLHKNNQHEPTPSDDFLLTCYQFDKKPDTPTTSQQTISLNDYKQRISHYYNQHATTTGNDTLFDGLLGFIGYDVAAYQLNPTIAIDNAMPCAFFGHYDCYIAYDDNDTTQHKACGNLWLYGTNADKLNFIQQCITQFAPNTPSSIPNNRPNSAVIFETTWTKNDYQNAFWRVNRYLKAGDAYQINLTQQLTAQSTLFLSDYLVDLFAQTQAPYFGYLLVNQCEILSVSPELFFEFHRTSNNSQQIKTKPIKGTRPRHHDPIIDNQLKNELKNSEKDLSENVMIVDLLRNDLGKYAKTGQVAVPVRFEIESFSHVHHMVSTIIATLKDDVSIIDVLFDSLPAGSITGSPKKRACEIIDELEAKPRAAYCGTMGLIGFDGIGAFNVLIRTLQSHALPSHPPNSHTPQPPQNSRQLTLWAGGGITVLSDSDAEYQECFDKINHIITLFANGKPS